MCHRCVMTHYILQKSLWHIMCRKTRYGNTVCRKNRPDILWITKIVMAFCVSGMLLRHIMWYKSRYDNYMYQKMFWLIVYQRSCYYICVKKSLWQISASPKSFWQVVCYKSRRYCFASRKNRTNILCFKKVPMTYYVSPKMLCHIMYC